MSKIIEKTIKATWTCDWCDKTVINESEAAPEGWTDTDYGGEPCGGNHFCCDDHYIKSKIAWENGFDAAIEAQAEYHEEQRQAFLETVNDD